MNLAKDFQQYYLKTNERYFRYAFAVRFLPILALVLIHFEATFLLVLKVDICINLFKDRR